MAQIDAICAACTLYGTLTHRKDDGVALLEWDDLGTRLHARTLFGQDKLAAGEVAARLRQQDGDLNREDVLAVDILVQAIVVVLMVLKHQRRRAMLACGMAALDEGFMRLRITRIDTHGLIPAIGDRYEVGIEGRAQGGDERRKGVSEISVLALPETVPAHDDAAAIKRFRIVARRKSAACGRLQQRRNDGASMRVECRFDATPVDDIKFGEQGADRIDAGGIVEIVGDGVVSGTGGHAQACAPGRLRCLA